MAKSALKWISIATLSIIVSLGLLNLYGIVNDEKLLVPLTHYQPNAADTAQNGFQLIKQLDQSEPETLAHYKEKQQLKELVWGKWNNTDAEQLLDKYRSLLSLPDQILNYSIYRSDPFDSTSAGFSDTSVLLARMQLLQSRHQMESGHIAEALESTRLAIELSQTIKLDDNAILISFMLGLAAQHEAIDWVHKPTSDYSLETKYLEKAIELLSLVEAYSNDHFYKALDGEYQFMGRELDILLSETPLTTRIHRFIEGQWYLTPYHTPDFYHFAHVLSVASPKYFLHKNNLLNFWQQQLTTVKANSSCQARSDIKNEPTNRSWFSAFKPNSIGQLFKDNFTIDDFTMYFARRCLADFHLQAVRTTIQIKLHEQQTGSPIQSLSELKFTNTNAQNLDKFSGEHLLFDAENRWLYSVGGNLEDDGGSVDSLYFRRCFANPNCTNNPTLPLQHQTNID